MKMSQLIFDNEGTLHINIVPDIGFSDVDKKT